MLSLLVAITLAQTPAPQVASGTRGVVVCDEPLAAAAGIEVLNKGGNAVDAAAAVAFAMAVVEPTAGNLGGGGFMLVRMADGRQSFIDYREQAPQAASRNMYVSNPIDSTEGLKAGGVPGTVAGMHEASARFGKLTWKEIVEPAYRLANDGFALSGSQARAWERSTLLAKFPESRRIYQRNGNYYKVGERVRLNDLANTFRRIRDRGWTDFYRGETARLIVQDMRKRGGLITAQDLADYRVRFRSPLRGTYRGLEVITAPPPSSGGIAMLNMLNILELGAPDFGSANTVHRMTEAMKLAFADRAELLGDPDFVRVPVAELTSKIYAEKRARLIDPKSAIPSTRISQGVEVPKESEETTHFSVIDADGNCVSNTYTLNGGFGSGDTIVGTGILLNNEMDDFAANPGKPNMYGLLQGERNAIEGGKRPLSSMTPTIVLKQGKPLMILGSPGGPTIINTVTQVLLAFVDGGVTPAAAVQSPRLHHQWMPDVLYAEAGTNPEIVDALKAKGHEVRERGSQGIANCIFIAPDGTRTGVADRRYGAATALAQ